MKTGDKGSKPKANKIEVAEQMKKGKEKNQDLVSQIKIPWTRFYFCAPSLVGSLLSMYCILSKYANRDQ